MAPPSDQLYAKRGAGVTPVHKLWNYCVRKESRTLKLCWYFMHKEDLKLMTETPEKTAYYACYTVTRCCSHWSRPLLVTSSNACVHLASLLRSRSCVCRAAVIGNLLLFCTKPAAQVWQHHVTMTTGRIATLFYNFVWVYAAGQWQRCPHQEMLEVAALTCKGFPVCL